MKEHQPHPTNRYFVKTQQITFHSSHSTAPILSQHKIMMTAFYGVYIIFNILILPQAVPAVSPVLDLLLWHTDHKATITTTDIKCPTKTNSLLE